MAGCATRLTILCCDNIRHNGNMLESNFKRYLAAVGDRELLGWLAGNVSFPCSMVDRITPKPTSALVKETRELFNRENDGSVMGEDFIQWVVENNFAADFPKLEAAGVTITDDVTPYEETKIRVLNGGHTCLVYLGALKGHGHYHDLLQDPELLDHYTKYEIEEVLPALPDNLPFDKTRYYKTVTARFGNAHIADSVERICMDGYNKFPIFILPTVRRCFELGLEPLMGIRSIASWYVFARNIESGSLTFRYYEPYMAELRKLLQPDGLHAFVNSQELWGDLPDVYPKFVEILKSEIERLGERWPA
jgi:D-arabinitol 4-dehydrogenase